MPVASSLERYRRISTLGAGGMAVVDLAEDTVLGRKVALKRVSAEADVRGLSRLRREALAGASLSHPNLVSIYDVITAEDGGAVIVMEYVPGETLAQRLSREGRLGAREALRILGGVADGLDAIHRRGIVHRDVKPANILLGASGAVKLADLGVASVPDRTKITTEGAVIGTFRYMALEQLEGTPATEAIDVYALAVVGYEMLSGEVARRAPNPVALAHAIATQPAPDLRQAWPEAPASAAELLMRGMSSKPAERPRSAGDLVARLRAALEPATTARSRSSRPARRPRPAVPAAPPPPTRRPPVPVVPPPPTRRPSPRARPAPVVPAASVVPTDSAPTHSARPGPHSPGGSRRAGLLAALGLALVVAVVAVVLADSGGSAPSSSGTHAASRGSAAAKHHSAPATPVHHASTTASTTASGTSTPTTAPPTTAGGGGASSNTTPVATVESFYHLAAAHQYAQAWQLADPTFRSQLRGYVSFGAGQADDRSITFDSARVVSQSTTAATVAVTTTSVRTDGTKHCSGTVELVPGSPAGTWLMHQIDINCV